MKYDLAKMLEEIRDDERTGREDEGERKILSQAEIREMAKNRRRKGAAEKPKT